MKKSKCFAPPCGVDCSKCPRYQQGKNPCEGYEQGCKARKCKSIYGCCVLKKGLDYCYQCHAYPCARYKKFAESWQKLGDDLYKNQQFLKENGAAEFNKAKCK